MAVATIETQQATGDRSFGRRPPITSAKPLYPRIYDGIQLPPPRKWSPELSKMANDYLFGSQADQPDVSPKWVEELIAAVEEYANDPRNHQPSAPNPRQQRGQLSAYAWKVISSKLHPSFRLFAVQYLMVDERVRARTKVRVLNENRLEQRQYTKAEVMELLKMFSLLDRLTNPQPVLAEERRRASEEFYLDPAEAPKLLQQMRQEAERLAEARVPIGLRIRGRLWSRRREVGRSEANGMREQPHADSIDYRKIRDDLMKSFTAAVAEKHEKGDWAHLEHGKTGELLRPDLIRAKMRKFGVKADGTLIRRLQEVAKGTLRQLFVARFGKEDTIRHPRTREIYHIDLGLPSRYGREAEKAITEHVR